MINRHGFLSVTRVLSVIALGVIMSGCVSLLPDPSPAPTIYRLSVPQSLEDSRASSDNVVNIEYPTAPRGLSGTDIVLSPDGRRLTSAAQANWAEAVPSMVRNSLIDTLARDGQVIGVIPKGSTRVPYRLNTDLRRFEAVFDQGEDAAPNIVVQINVALTDTKTRQIIGVHTVTKETRAGMRTVSSIVDAKDRATREAMDDISAWLVRQVLADKS
ncbi:MAG: hypothetical protein EX271_07360 [Acidimicrobiales bacterium]|nr:hypothetical protein [Hyphomonadaceae bacterium]RZV41763.1 MAG: hypothetical protein EX271_07360 [Acidimicrobiales bacterium]